MPDNTDLDLDRDYIPDLEGPDEDDAEGIYDPDTIEVSRARELGLGVGARDLQRQRQRDVSSSGSASLDGGAERMSSEDLQAADIISGDDASDLGIDEDFDSEDDGPDAERLDDRATSRPR